VLKLSNLSLDTNIYLKAYLGTEKERKRSNDLIFTNKYSPIIVRSVRREFIHLFDNALDFFERLIELIEEGKTFQEAKEIIKIDPKIFSKQNMIKDLKKFGFDIKDINTNQHKRAEFLEKINKKISDIKQIFEADIADFNKENKDYNKEIKPLFEKLNDSFEKINKEYEPKKPIHPPDTEHWIRTANYTKEHILFITNDYFGLKQNKHRKIKKQIETLLNNQLNSQFEFRFFYNN
jgi:predicted nucleic acid-binding protein